MEITNLTNQLTGWKELLSKTVEKFPINSEIRNKLYNNNNILNSNQDGFLKRSCGHYIRKPSIGGRYRGCPLCDQIKCDR
jgi:hypothetical protein